MARLNLNKAVHTTKISRDEATEYFQYLALFTDDRIKKEFGWYVKKGYWPLQAQRKDKAQKKPKFAVAHHTSNRHRNFKPALNRFFSARKASSNLLIGDHDDDVFLLVGPDDMSFHAINRQSFDIDLARTLNIERGWVNEFGTEVAGNGGARLFSYSQFLNFIALHRYLVSYYPTIKEIKSHRFFSPKSRSGDPGVLFLLPLVEHAVFNDVDLKSKNYWLEDYKKNPVKFVNNSSFDLIKSLNLEDRDEWISLRKGFKVLDSFL